MAKKIKFENKNLKELLKSLQNDYVLRVGIIGAKASSNHDKSSSLTNADIGTFHEFGTERMPRRSFLEDSLKFKLKDFNTEKFRNLRKLAWKWIFDKKAMQNFLNILGAKCLEYIEEGFATNGFGMWKPLASSTKSIIAKKHKVLTMDKALNASMAKYLKANKFWHGDLVRNPDGSIGIAGGRNILTETGKLRRSITFKVIKRK